MALLNLSGKLSTNRWKLGLQGPGVIASGPQFGIIAPTNNNSGPGPTLFAFTGSALVQFAPATWVFNTFFNQQDGYYTTVFYDRADWNGDYSVTLAHNGYVGTHPYPSPSGGTSNPNHNFEVSAEGTDYQTDANGHDTTLVTGQWYRQAVRVTIVGGLPYVEFFWNIAAGMDYVIQYPFQNPSSGFTNPGMCFLATGWTSPEFFQTIETMDGILRNLQLYPSALTNTQIQSASACNYDSQIGALGLGAWYYNANLKPTDISDKSGNGHNPAWVNPSFTGTLWTGP